MAEIPLKTLKLHGLDNTYYIPDAQSIANQALNDAKSYTNGLMKKVAPRNLLDNSDFTNPVNQRGFTSLVPGTTSTYFLDRWYSARTNLELIDDGLSLAWDEVNGTDGWIQQKIPNGKLWYGKKLTAVIELDDGSKIIASGIVPTTVNQSVVIYGWDSKGIRLYYTNMANSDVFSIVININTTTSVIIKNIAIYEGEYTAETLPEYQSKGYGAELAECQRYYRVLYCDYKTVALLAKQMRFRFENVRMRIAPTVKILELPTSIRYAGKEVELADVSLNNVIYKEDSLLVYLVTTTSLEVYNTGYVQTMTLELSADL